MPHDFVQIGPYLVSSKVIDAIALFAATALGGLIAFYSASLAEDRRWKREKRDRLAHEKRQALTSAMQFVASISQEALLSVERIDGLLNVNDTHPAVTPNLDALRDRLKSAGTPELPSIWLPYWPNGAFDKAREALALTKQATQDLMHLLLVLRLTPTQLGERAADLKTIRATFGQAVGLVADVQVEIRKEYANTFD